MGLAATERDAAHIGDGIDASVFDEGNKIGWGQRAVA